MALDPLLAQDAPHRAIGSPQRELDGARTTGARRRGQTHIIKETPDGVLIPGGSPVFDGFATRQVPVDGAQINLRVGGSGPPLLLLHGYPQTGAMWAAVAARLRDEWTVVCPDLRGYGRSRADADEVGAFSFRAMADDQLAVMAELGHDRFAVIGHDRGGRTAHRMTLDHPDVVTALGFLDIAPTYDMLTDVTRESALAYWHWYLLAQPAPFPERLIGADADYFFDTCFRSWGRTHLDALDQEQLAEYRAAWNDPSVVHATCNDYRAAVSVDLEHDRADRDRRIMCPTLVVWGADGALATMVDVEKLWRARAEDVSVATVPGGHFFVDLEPERTADLISAFLRG